MKSKTPDALELFAAAVGVERPPAAAVKGGEQCARSGGLDPDGARRLAELRARAAKLKGAWLNALENSEGGAEPCPE